MELLPEINSDILKEKISEKIYYLTGCKNPVILSCNRGDDSGGYSSNSSSSSSSNSGGSNSIISSSSSSISSISLMTV